MRVLIINSMFYNEAYRKCVDQLGILPGIDLTVLTVKAWVMNSRREPCAPFVAGSPYHTVTGSTLGTGKENRGLYISGLVEAFRRSRPEVIFLMEEPFSLFSVQVLFLRELFAKNTPVVFFTWNNLSLDEFDYRPTIWYRTVARWTLPRMQYALTANSDAVAVLRSKRFQGPMKSIGYGVDTSIFTRLPEKEAIAYKEKLAIPLSATVIGFVGRLIGMKGVDLLIGAFAKLRRTFPEKEYILLLVGSGIAEAELLEQAQREGISDAIRRVPSVTQADVPKYMSLIDTLVLPSRRHKMWAEQFGRVMVEAMAMRIAVVGSSSGSIPEVIGDAGYVFEENNSDDLFEKLCAIERLTPGARKELLDRGEYRGREHYSWRRFAEGCYAAIQEAYTAQSA